MIRKNSTRICMVLFASMLCGQMWQQNDNLFNPSGVPSLPFSQPRFADLDGDEDYDMILGHINGRPLYFENTGSTSSPTFAAGDDLFSVVAELDCEVGVCVDLDSDGDLDFITGGYTGLQLYDNTGDASSPSFSRIDEFFSDLSVGTNPVPHFADMDNDGDLDMVVGYSESGAVDYFQNFGTATEAIFLAGESENWFDVGLYAYPWFADLDGDDDYDLLVGRDGFGFRYYRNDGSTSAWNWTTASTLFSSVGQSTYWNSPCLVDLTGDGKLDLIHGTASGPLKYYRNSGTLSSPSWSAVTSLFGGVMDVGGASTPIFVDMDDDGDLDLISGSTLGDIKYYKNTGTAYAPAWTANHGPVSSIDHSIYAAVGVGDLNGDHRVDLVIGDLSGNLYFHPNNGTSFPHSPGLFDGINVGGFSVPRLFDFDRDGDLDLVVGREDGQLSYFENTGSAAEAQWTEDPTMFAGIDVGSNCFPSFGDIDLDGSLDMITGDLFHELQIFIQEDGVWIEQSELVSDLVVGQNAAPALADLNGDGDLDLTVGNYDGTFNYFENLTIVSTEPIAQVPSGNHLFPPSPNPFNPSTQLHFELGASASISLQIFDVTGRMITEIAQGYYEMGLHTVNWNGTDAQGNLLASGTYIAVLRSDHDLRATRLMLLK